MPKFGDITGYPWLGRHKSGFIYLRIFIAGYGMVIRTTGETSLAKALPIAKRMLVEVEKHDPRRLPSQYDEIARECFALAETKWRPRTREEAYRILDLYLLPAFGRYPIHNVTDSLWSVQYEVWQAKRKRKTFQNVRKYAVKIDNYAFRKGYKKSRCDFPIEDPKARRGLNLSPKQFRKIRKAVVSDHVGLFLLMGATMGMRRNEMLQLTWNRVDIPRRRVTLRPEDVKTGSKTGRGREIAISPEVLPLITACKATAETEWVFPNRMGTGPLCSVKRPMELLRKKVGFHFTPHDLRHTFLTRKILVEKKSPAMVSEYAGVSLRTIQSTYLHTRAEHTESVVGWGEE